jgi:hypothetical protein
VEKRVAEAVLDLMKHGLSVEGLVDEVAEKVSVDRHVVARHLYELWREGRLRLEDSQPPSTLSQYFGSLYSWWFWVLVSIVAFTASSIYLFPQTPPYIYLRYAAGCLFVLYLPGVALIEALYPGKDGLQPLERLALSIGLSLALVPLVGLVLNYTPWGIRLNSIYVSLASLTIMLAASAVARKFSMFKDNVHA